MNARRCTLGLAAALLLLAGCGGDDERRLTPPPPPDYLPNDSPENLVANLTLAWEAEDAAGYAALLYDGVLEADDGEVYAPFTFYFDQSVDPDLPDQYLYAQEVACLENLLSGEPGDGVPGVRSVSMDLVANGTWQTVVGGEVEGDPCPENTQWRAFETDLLVTLKTNIGYSDINQWLVQDRLLVHCLPVLVAGETEWRLWKWRDLIELRAGESSLGTVKARYGPTGRESGTVEDASLGGIKVLYASAGRQTASRQGSR
ncbi:hypothetical protein FJ251_06615 [bacterium]|nr:hypothetical protein [bacterium]